MTLNPPELSEGWCLDDAPMTDKQQAVLAELCVWLGEDYDPGLTQVEAALQIEELRRILSARALWEQRLD